MAGDPTVVIFDTNPTSGTLPAGRDVLQSWKHGPKKMKSFSRRGRPKKNLDAESDGGLSTARFRKEICRTQLGSATPPLYEFVACKDASGNADTAARKTIRSHVMRNYRRRQDQLNDSYAGKDTPMPPYRQLEGKFNERELVNSKTKRASSVDLASFSTFDPFACLPVRIQPYMLEVLSKYTTCSYERIYSIEKYTDYNPMRDCFLPMAFQDVALLHAIMFSSVCLKTLQPKYREVPKAITHLRECIRLINERLQSPALVIDDSTILVVLMVAYSEKLTGHHENWAVHMRGLKRLVQLRGGLSKIRSSGALYGLILRVDLHGSIDALTEPYFDDLDLSLPIRDVQITCTSEGFRKLNHFYPLKRDLNFILRKVEDATIALNHIHMGDMIMNPLDLREELTTIQYILLRTELSRHTSHESDTEHLCRLSLLLYLVTILNDLLPGASKCDTLAETVRTMLDGVPGERIIPEFRWWLVLLIGVIAVEEANKSWAKRAFEGIASHPYVSYRRESAKVPITKFFWVEKIHGEKFDKLWAEALGVGGDAFEDELEPKSSLSSEAEQLIEGRRCSDYGTWLGSLM